MISRDLEYWKTQNFPLAPIRGAYSAPSWFAPSLRSVVATLRVDLSINSGTKFCSGNFLNEHSHVCLSIDSKTDSRVFFKFEFFFAMKTARNAPNKSGTPVSCINNLSSQSVCSKVLITQISVSQRWKTPTQLTISWFIWRVVSCLFSVINML